MARELSPRAVALLLAPEWRFDDVVLGDGWRLDDVHAARGAASVVVALRDGSRQLELAVEPASDAPASERVAGLAVSWLAPGPRDAGQAACLALARLLGRKCDAREPGWSVPSDAVRRIPERLAEEVRTEPARVSDDPDGALLDVDAAHYRRLYGSVPRGVRVVVAGGEASGISMHFPAPLIGAYPPSGRIYEVPPRFHRRRFRRYFAALGCMFEDGFPRTVPSPTTFAHAVASASAHPPPLAPRLRRSRRATIPARRWVAGIVKERVLSVAVAPRWAVEAHRVLRRVERLSQRSIDVGMLVHDVSLHALGIHAVAGEDWSMLLAAARERFERADRRGHTALATFFEGTLTRTAWEVWRSIEAPEEFADVFSARAPDLVRELRAA